MIQLIPCCLEIRRCTAVSLPHKIFLHQEYEKVCSLHVALSQIFSSPNKKQSKTHYIQSAIYTFFSLCELSPLFDALLSQNIHAHPLYFTFFCAEKHHPLLNFDFVPVEKGSLTVFK